MTMLAVSAAELAAIQADAVTAVCDQVCVVQRKGARVPTSQGGNSATYATIETTVAGMAEPTAGQLTNYQYLIGSLAAWTVRLPVASVAQELDHLVIGGQTLEVKKVLRPRSYEALKTVLAVEVK